MRKLICFTGGGTAGHVAPGCAVIDYLRDNSDYSFYWIGSKAKNEKHILNRYKIPYKTIPAGKLRRYFSLLNFIDLFKIGFGFIAAFFILLLKRPILIFSKGGYVSFPPLVAAKILRISVISHESDLVPGLATRLNIKLSMKIILTYEESKKHFASSIQKKLIVLGNPVRKEIYSGDKEFVYKNYSLDRKKKTILVTGGSQGAKQINDLIDANIEKLLKQFNVIHQCGSTFTPSIKHENYICRSFFNEEFTHFITCSDIIISRAGASALWEWAAVRKPAIIIPLSTGSSRGDQLGNAAYFAAKNCILSFDNPDPDDFYTEVVNLAGDNKKRKQMEDNLSAFMNENPAERIADYVITFMEEIR